MSEILAANDRADATPKLNFREVLLEVILRCSTALMLCLFAYAAVRQWLADPSRITLLLLVIASCLTVGLSLFVRVPKKRDWNPITVLCSLGASYYFLGIQLAPGQHLVPEIVGACLQLVGITWQIYAKLTLRFSFGILPANRGIVSHGAYRFVRHPIYLGYLIADVGFLLTNFGLQNLLVYTGLYALQAVRINREEALLSDDPEYREYREKVRFRAVPGIY
ncbi:isoprenylcysteine carboxylmethyltransferase family protein [Cupriavidus sp. AcVe19-6a]|uniref:methyltransferase family protein n=1 Tax=Cupriavidus sp. AcVe19-6a TaxID=2821358 RepID=UPI001AE3BF95|nr:isoprenylcysteine carboxylmethyltransferase family protein [Cupriavidus sp. AcVe19-6a]MBP0634424.1 isoprenylcysteine carboxylmethyltransferase family protein [Cupriavidus sp. AcVe19-6a]